MPFDNNIITAEDINSAWRDTLWCCVRNGYDYQVERGSYVGQIRRQLDSLMIRIDEPGAYPLAVTLPEHLPFSAPTDETKISQYFQDYLISGEKEEGEEYTYGEFIAAQLDRIIETLSTSRGQTNQATITVGDPYKAYTDPPCLRVIDFKVVPRKNLDSMKELTMTLFFRSWDIFAGLPENLGGLQLLKEYVLAYLPPELGIEDGAMIAYSSGAHIYEMYFPLVNQLNIDKIGEREENLK